MSVEGAKKRVRRGPGIVLAGLFAWAGIHLATGNEKPPKGELVFVGDDMIPADATRRKTYPSKNVRKTTPEWDACADAGCDPMPPKYEEPAKPKAKSGNPPAAIPRAPLDQPDPFDNQWNA